MHRSVSYSSAAVGNCRESNSHRPTTTRRNPRVVASASAVCEFDVFDESCSSCIYTPSNTWSLSSRVCPPTASRFCRAHGRDQHRHRARHAHRHHCACATRVLARQPQALLAAAGRGLIHGPLYIREFMADSNMTLPACRMSPAIVTTTTTKLFGVL